jgi:hypothetical protein
MWLRDFGIGIVGRVDGKSVRFGGMSFTLTTGTTEGEGSWVGVEELPPLFVQRALLELTGGGVDLDSLGLALDLQEVTDDQEMADWEAWLSEVLVRAEGMEADAREIARRLASAGDAGVVEIPLYGTGAQIRVEATGTEPSRWPSGCCCWPP